MRRAVVSGFRPALALTSGLRWTGTGGRVGVEQSYDALGRLIRQRVRTRAEGPSLIERRFHFDARGLLTRIESEGQGPTTYEYDAAERMTRYLDGATGREERFDYDAAGNVQGAVSGGGSIAYVYDTGDRLGGAGNTEFAYD